ncbi:hypothetical protein F4778DRAFT_764990 [Xylariomycetidae sp. FL2044]|nr:hypothetical protein F4778DRAFT_764990 [Xylariomycetidae sp. FL2044]
MSDQEPKADEPMADSAEASIPTSQPQALDSEVKSDTTAKPKDVEMNEVEAVSTGQGETKEQTPEDKDGDEAASKTEHSKNSKRGEKNSRYPEGMLRVRYDKEDKNMNQNKFDVTGLNESDDPVEIRKQVEFYLGDSNLPSDKFLREKVGPDNDAVPLEIICSFQRMRRYKPYSAVVAALKDSRVLVVEGEEGKEAVRRKQPYDAAKAQPTKRDERSIYAKGFGEEGPRTQFDIEAFFTQFGEHRAVRLRRGKDNQQFKGSVFVEWADKETAEKFMAMEPKPKWQGEHPLLIEWKLDYQARKVVDIRNGTIKPNQKDWKPRGRGGRGHHGGNSGRGRGQGHRGGDPDDWKKRRDDDQRNGFRDRRGGRGRGRGNFRGRGRDRNENAREQAKAVAVDSREAGRPVIHTSKGGAKTEAGAKSNEESKTNANGKRTRDEEGSKTEEPASKKVDSKENTS